MTENRRQGKRIGDKGKVTGTKEQMTGNRLQVTQKGGVGDRDTKREPEKQRI